MMQTRLQIVFFAVFLTAAAALFRYFSGPFYFGSNSDPSYFYLFNFLYLLEGRSLEFVDHPGTTLDLLGALVIKIFFPAPANTLWLSHYTLQAEKALHLVWLSMMLVYAGTLMGLGFYVFHKTRDRIFTGLVLLGSLWLLIVRSFNNQAILPISANVNSDTMMMTAVNLMIWAVLGFYFSSHPRSLRQAVSLGAAVVFAMATKFTALPFLLVALCILATWRQRVLLVVLTAAGFVALTFPLWGSYGHLWWWLKGLVMTRGMHGSGGEGFDAQVFLRNGWWVVKNHWFFILIWIGAGAAGFVRQDDAKIRRVLAALALGGLVQVIIVAKQTSYQYMAPMVGLSSVPLALLYKAFPDWWDRVLKQGVIIILAVSLALIPFSMWQVYAKTNKTRAMLETIAKDYKDCRVCPFYRSSASGFSLVFWNRVLERTEYSEILKKYYPDLVYYDIFGRDFKNSAQQVVPLAALRQQAARVLIYGIDIDPKGFEPFLKVKRIYGNGGPEALFEVTGAVSYYGTQYFEYAKLMYSQGRYQDAYNAAMVSQQLGVGQDLSGLIEALRQKAQTP